MGLTWNQRSKLEEIITEKCRPFAEELQKTFGILTDDEITQKAWEATVIVHNIPGWPFKRYEELGEHIYNPKDEALEVIFGKPVVDYLKRTREKFEKEREDIENSLPFKEKRKSLETLVHQLKQEVVFFGAKDALAFIQSLDKIIQEKLNG